MAPKRITQEALNRAYRAGFHNGLTITASSFYGIAGNPWCNPVEVEAEYTQGYREGAAKRQAG